MTSYPSPQTTDRLYWLSNNGKYGKLVQYICNHKNERVRFGAAGVLTESEDFIKNETSELRQELIKSVLNDPSDDVRAMVLEVLFKIDRSIADTIISWLQAEPDSTPTGTPYPLILTKWHSKRQPPLRILALTGFGRVGSHSAKNKIHTSIKNEEDLDVLHRAIKEGGRVGDERFVSAIQEHLRIHERQYYEHLNQGEIDEIKEVAIESLVKIGSDAAYEALLTASRSTDENLKQHAISKIGKFGAQDAVDVIIDELDNEDNDELRKEAAEGVLTSFSESDFDKQGDIRQQAIQTISQNTDVDVCEEFASIIDESPENVERRNAAWLLGQIQTDNDTAVETLIESLQSDDKHLREVSAASLANLDPTLVEPQIKRLLSSLEQESSGYELASFIQSSIKDEAEEAKKEIVEYSYVTHPDDYTSG